MSPVTASSEDSDSNPLWKKFPRVTKDVEPPPGNRVGFHRPASTHEVRQQAELTSSRRSQLFTCQRATRPCRQRTTRSAKKTQPATSQKRHGIMPSRRCSTRIDLTRIPRGRQCNATHRDCPRATSGIRFGSGGSKPSRPRPIKHLTLIATSMPRQGGPRS